MNQKGFATLEVILMVLVIGVLASIAVPRFTAVTTAANTAKIQSDMTTINTAIQIYHMEYGEDKDPAEVKDLVTDGYLQAVPVSPSGNCYVDGESKAAPATSYTIQTKDGEVTQAILGEGNTVDKFYIPKKGSQDNPSGD